MTLIFFWFFDYFMSVWVSYCLNEHTVTVPCTFHCTTKFAGMQSRRTSNSFGVISTMGSFWGNRIPAKKYCKYNDFHIFAVGAMKIRVLVFFNVKMYWRYNDFRVLSILKMAQKRCSQSTMLCKMENPNLQKCKKFREVQ